MEIRPATLDDHAAVRELLDAAFAGEGVGALWDDVRTRGHVCAELVAVVDARVAGHVGLSQCWVDARERLVDAWLLGPLASAADRQRHGVGTALVAAALAAAAAARVPAVFLEGSPAYYGRRGFVRASGAGFEPPSRRTPDAAFQVALTDSHQPWMVGRVIYPSVWWEHDAAGLRDPLLAELEQVLGSSYGSSPQATWSGNP